MTDHARWADAAGAYLLDALEAQEKTAYEAHLATCAQCREDVEQLRVATDALPHSVDQYDAPPALKDRIMAIVESEAELLRAAGPEADRASVLEPRRSRRWWQFVPRSGLAFAATLLLIAGGVTGWAMRDGESDPARTVVADVTSPGATAQLVVRREHSTLIAKKLPRPGAGRVYQVWLKRAGAAAPEPTDALFTVRHDGSASVDVPGSLEGVEAVLVTAEPEGGSQAPTSDPVIAAVPA
jgi:anti-sigma-K factor RskA